MPIFISYSRQDKEFVDKLAAQLVLNKARVWVDRWELNVGDSLLDRIQDAIGGAGALIAVLSPESVESEWCRRELNAGLIRELDERRVLVLPALVADCEMPVFLRDKLYADFRENFDDGLNSLLNAVAKVTNDTQDRIDKPDFHVDWAIDWGWLDELFSLRITVLLLDTNKPYSVLSETRILLDETMTARYKAFEEEGLDWIERLAVISALGATTSKNKVHFWLDDQFEKQKTLGFNDTRSQGTIHCVMTCRRMGQDTGQDVFVDLSDMLGQVCSEILETTRKATDEEMERFAALKGRLG